MLQYTYSFIKEIKKINLLGPRWGMAQLQIQPVY